MTWIFFYKLLAPVFFYLRNLTLFHCRIHSKKYLSWLRWANVRTSIASKCNIVENACKSLFDTAIRDCISYGILLSSLHIWIKKSPFISEMAHDKCFFAKVLNKTNWNTKKQLYLGDIFCGLYGRLFRLL